MGKIAIIISWGAPPPLDGGAGRGRRLAKAEGAVALLSTPEITAKAAGQSARRGAATAYEGGATAPRSGQGLDLIFREAPGSALPLVEHASFRMWVGCWPQPSRSANLGDEVAVDGDQSARAPGATMPISPPLLGQLDRQGEAKEASAKAVATAPVAFEMYIRARPPSMRTEDHAHMLEGLRKAGLPEG